MDTKAIADKLSEKGLRVTPQRIAILGAIIKLNNHPTAENIIEYIKNNHPNISVGTVYKVLDSFVENHLLKKVKTEGGVIQPGMDLVEIVPFDDSLLVDAKVLPRDIAFIHPHQKAIVKFTAYDFAVHGGLPAKVTLISPDTIEDKEGVSYYQVRLQTESSHLGKAEEPLPIIAGMTVQVDILTGKKTVMDYLLKPILKTKQLALRER